MPEFRYTVLDPRGTEIRSGIVAGSKGEAAAALRREGKFVVSIRPADGAGTSTGGGGILGRQMDLESLAHLIIRPSGKDVVLMFRQLAVLINSGVSIVHALNILHRQARKGGIKRLIKGLAVDVEGGVGLSDAMVRNRRVFSLYMISMIRTAEVSGELDTVMGQIADQLETDMAFRQQMITSMIYPCIVVVFTVVAIGILALVVVPKFTPILKSGGRHMPWPTQALLDITQWVQAWWQKGMLFIAAGGVSAFLLKKTQGGGYLVDWVLIKLPVVGKILQCGVVVDFSRNLGILLKSGVPVSDALKTIRNTLRNQVGARVVGKMNDFIMEGKSMSEPLKMAEHVFPPMVAEMAATGEETGEMEKVLNLTADVYQKMLETYVKRMNTLIEPVLIVILGGMVGFVIFALMAGVLAMYGV